MKESDHNPFAKTDVKRYIKPGDTFSIMDIGDEIRRKEELLLTSGDIIFGLEKIIENEFPDHSIVYDSDIGANRLRPIKIVKREKEFEKVSPYSPDPYPPSLKYLSLFEANAVDDVMRDLKQQRKNRNNKR